MVGFTRPSASWLRCLPSDVWQSGGPAVPHIPIGLSTRIHCSATQKTVFPVKTGRLPVDTTLSAWLLAEEETLRKDRYLRDKNATVAYSLLPIFESDPRGWNSIRKLPDSSATVRDYLHDWHSTVDPVDRPFVNRILNAFE